MKNKYLSCNYNFVISILLIFIFISCKKTDETNITDFNPRRIIEWVSLDNGIEHMKGNYHYENGKLSSYYVYHWGELKAWEDWSMYTYEYVANTFIETRYTKTDTIWVPSSVMQAKFSGGNPVEVIFSNNRKWEWSYQDNKLVLCVIQEYLNMQWGNDYKTEYLYHSNNIYKTNSYEFNGEIWTLDRYSEINYQNNVIDEISLYELVQDEWMIENKYKFVYSNNLISQLICFRAYFMSDSLYLDYTYDFEYDEYDNIVYERIIEDGSVIEEYYTYEAASGNYGATIGALCYVINYPLVGPVPVKGKNPIYANKGMNSMYMLLSP